MASRLTVHAGWVRVGVILMSLSVLPACMHLPCRGRAASAVVACSRDGYVRLLDEDESLLLLRVLESSIAAGERGLEHGTDGYSYYLSPAYDVFEQDAGGIYRGKYTVDEAGSGVWVYGRTGGPRFAIQSGDRDLIGLLLTPYRTEAEAYRESFEGDARAAQRARDSVVFPPPQ